MNEINIKDRVNEFCKYKNIDNLFVKECIVEFIEGHTSLFGTIIPEEDLFKRLENNLDKITFSERRGIQLGEYKGRIKDDLDQNEILIYAKETDLDISETDKKMWDLYTNADKQKLIQERDIRKQQVRSTLIHELTHAAYTIKDSYGIGEKHIFSENGRNLFGADYYSLVGGNSNYIEAIVNYISSKIEGRSVEEIQTYKYETKSIYMLAEKMGEEPIIKSAWYSDEKSFKESYEEKIGKSYTTFNNYMGKLVGIRYKELEIGQYTIQSENILNNMEQLLQEKEIYINENKSFQERNSKETENVFDGKSGFDDVSNSSIRKSLLDRVTAYIKETFKRKQRTKENEEER